MKAIAITLVVAGALTLGACKTSQTDDSGSSGGGGSGKSPGEQIFTDDYCTEQAPKLLAEYPSIYYSVQEAYDACRRAAGLTDEISGYIHHSP